MHVSRFLFLGVGGEVGKAVWSAELLYNFKLCFGFAHRFQSGSTVHMHFIISCNNLKYFSLQRNPISESENTSEASDSSGNVEETESSDEEPPQKRVTRRSLVVKEEPGKI